MVQGTKIRAFLPDPYASSPLCSLGKGEHHAFPGARGLRFRVYRVQGSLLSPGPAKMRVLHALFRALHEAGLFFFFFFEVFGV